jgi:hypothetical protein
VELVARKPIAGLVTSTYKEAVRTGSPSPQVLRHPRIDYFLVGKRGSLQDAVTMFRTACMRD